MGLGEQRHGKTQAGAGAGHGRADQRGQALCDPRLPVSQGPPSPSPDADGDGQQPTGGRQRQPVDVVVMWIRPKGLDSRTTPSNDGLRAWYSAVGAWLGSTEYSRKILVATRPPLPPAPLGGHCRISVGCSAFQVPKNRSTRPVASFRGSGHPHSRARQGGRLLPEKRETTANKNLPR